MDWQALFLSLKLASVTVLCVFVIGLPLAFILSQNPGRVSSWIESTLSMPLVLPPAVLGFYFLMILGPLHLAFTFYGLVIASVVYALPFALQPFLASFRSIHPEVLEASRMLGGSRFQTFLRVVLPLSLPGIVSGGILAFVHVLGEFGVVLMIGGNIPGESRTLSISIYDEIQSLNFSLARRMSAVLLCICFITVMYANYFSKVNRLRFKGQNK